MFDATYPICFDYDVLLPGPLPLLVLKNKNKDLKKEKIGDSTRRARCLDLALVCGAQIASKASQIASKMKQISGKMEAQK